MQSSQPKFRKSSLKHMSSPAELALLVPQRVSLGYRRSHTDNTNYSSVDNGSLFSSPTMVTHHATAASLSAQQSDSLSTVSAVSAEGRGAHHRRSSSAGASLPQPFAQPQSVKSNIRLEQSLIDEKASSAMKDSLPRSLSSSSHLQGAGGPPPPSSSMLQRGASSGPGPQWYGERMTEITELEQKMSAWNGSKPKLARTTTNPIVSPVIGPRRTAAATSAFAKRKSMSAAPEPYNLNGARMFASATKFAPATTTPTTPARSTHNTNGGDVNTSPDMSSLAQKIAAAKQRHTTMPAPTTALLHCELKSMLAERGLIDNTIDDNNNTTTHPNNSNVNNSTNTNTNTGTHTNTNTNTTTTTTQKLSASSANAIHDYLNNNRIKMMANNNTTTTTIAGKPAAPIAFRRSFTTDASNLDFSDRSFDDTQNSTTDETTDPFRELAERFGRERKKSIEIKKKRIDQIRERRRFSIQVGEVQHSQNKSDIY